MANLLNNTELEELLESKLSKTWIQLFEWRISQLSLELRSTSDLHRRLEILFSLNELHELRYLPNKMLEEVDRLEKLKNCKVYLQP